MARSNNDNGTVNIHGKEYRTVALRVGEFRKDHPEKGLLADIISADDSRVVIKASIVGEDGRVLATGHAEESRNGSQINKTSALENCETSAIGRALAAFGYGGTEFASANEVQNAIHQQQTPAPKAKPADAASVKKLRQLITQAEISDDEVAEWLAKAGAHRLDDLTAEQVDKAIVFAQKRIVAPSAA